MAELAAFIMARPMSGERFHLLRPVDLTTDEDRKFRNIRIRGYSPEMKKETTVLAVALPYG